MDVATASLTSTDSVLPKTMLDSDASAKVEQCYPSKPTEGGCLPAKECLEKMYNDVLKEEVQDLIDDQVYNEFVVAIAKETRLDKSYLDEKKDVDFVPKFSSAKKLHLDQNVKESEADESVDAYESSDESTSSESDVSTSEENKGSEGFSKLIEDSEVPSEEVNLLKENIPVPIPKVSLTKTQDRYPPFWRVKHAIRNVGENDGYKSNEDDDFFPAKESEDKDGSVCENDKSDSMRENSKIDLTDTTSEDSSGEEDLDLDEMNDEVKVLEELPDLKHDIKGLSTMVQDMSVVNSQQNLPVENNSFNDAMEEEDVGFSPVNFAEAIIQHDDADYDETADPDYVPSLEIVKNGNEEYDCDTSATSDSTSDESDHSSDLETAMVQ